MARRLTRQTRDDVYGSRRDYQTIIGRQSSVFRLSQSNDISFSKQAILGTHDIIAFGGYIKPTAHCLLTITLSVDGAISASHAVQLSDSWNRIGVAADGTLPAECIVTLQFDRDIEYIELWGTKIDGVLMPDIFADKSISASDLNHSHIVPETYYLQHDQSFDLVIESGSLLEANEHHLIKLKKCSYCQRYLPLNPNRLGSLAFHKHNAKVTNHQNECRSCKKWRINGELNKLRTTDQLNESSVITRERKIFLQDSTALARFKLSNGEGLKSFIWKRFGKKCFKCNKKLLLKEVQLDHTRPLAYLWPIDEYATCLCATHNNEKKDRFPVEFYNDQELQALSAITGLDYHQLANKSLNAEHLERILKDVSTFAQQWEPRTFNAIARKIRELSPEIDLFSILRHENQALYDWLNAELARIPDLEETS
jgi:hypothetical protein